MFANLRSEWIDIHYAKAAVNRRSKQQLRDGLDAEGVDALTIYAGNRL